jgi:hypothetical protein
MGNFKGTPGKWKAVKYAVEQKKGESTHEIQYGEDGECVAEIVHGEFNAKLIALAPEMLEILEDALHVFETTDASSSELKSKIAFLIEKTN